MLECVWGSIVLNQACVESLFATFFILLIYLFNGTEQNRTEQKNKIKYLFCSVLFNDSIHFTSSSISKGPRFLI